MTRKLAPAAALVAAALAAAPAPASAQVQTLSLDPWQTTAQARTWQKSTWRQTLAWCYQSVRGQARWRSVIKNNQCGNAIRSAPLAANGYFKVTVSGLVSHWRGRWPETCGSPVQSFDPKRGATFYASMDAQWTLATRRAPGRCAGTRLPSIGTAFRVNVTADAAPAWWGFAWDSNRRKYVRNDHTYSFWVRGRGTPIWFSIYDHQVIDNHGSLNIRIEPYTSMPAGGDYMSPTQPPPDSWAPAP